MIKQFYLTHSWDKNGPESNFNDRALQIHQISAARLLPPGAF